MNEISAPRRLFFGVICIAALFVAYLGLFAPERLDESFTWVVLPPLHARFVGVLYLFGGVYMIGCILAPRWSQVSPALPAIGIFTSLLLLVTLLNLEAFDFDLGPVWVWTLSYIIYPTIAFALAWTARNREVPAVGGPLSRRGRESFLKAQAVVFALLGVLLLVARGAMVDVWPWPISEGLAQFYGGPFLAYAFCSWSYSGRRDLGRAGRDCAGDAGVHRRDLIVSLIHDELFSSSDLATWVWFLGFGGAALALLAITRARPACRRGRPQPDGRARGSRLDPHGLALRVVKPRISCAVSRGTSSCGQWPTPSSSIQSALGSHSSRKRAAADGHGSSLSSVPHTIRTGHVISARRAPTPRVAHTRSAAAASQRPPRATGERSGRPGCARSSWRPTAVARRRPSGVASSASACGAAAFARSYRFV